MAIKTEKIVGNEIINEIDSSNISKTIYNIEKKTMKVEFKNGAMYEYHGVPHSVYTRFRLSESQGKFLSSIIGKTFKYDKK